MSALQTYILFRRIQPGFSITVLIFASNLLINNSRKWISRSFIQETLGKLVFMHLEWRIGYAMSHVYQLAAVNEDSGQYWNLVCAKLMFLSTFLCRGEDFYVGVKKLWDKIGSLVWCLPAISGLFTKNNSTWITYFMFWQ